MIHDLALTKSNRLKLAEAFRHTPRVDLAIDCAVEGQMGTVLVDELEHPQAWCIVLGPFRYFGGDPSTAGGRELLESLQYSDLLMPAPLPWREAAEVLHGARLRIMPRYQFDAGTLDAVHLGSLLAQSKHQHRLMPLDAARTEQLSVQRDSVLDLAAFGSPGDFCDRGLGFAAVDSDRVLGVAYSSLVCSKGIEVSIYVDERHRGRGVATALACKLLLACLARGLVPHWDAANAESYRLAKKLGYTFTGMYEALYLTEE